MPLHPMPPTETVPLFPGVSQALLDLLRTLPEDDWAKPTACPGWSVKDIVAHLLGGNLGRLAFQRDRLQPTGTFPTPETLVDWINTQNQRWVEAGRRISPPILIDFLELTDVQLHAFFAILPPHVHGGVGVSWAGETSSPNWFDIGREYTEKWFHQQHIRDAVGRPGLMEAYWVRPVIELGMRAVPFTYNNIEAEENTTITLQITGPGGGTWSLVRQQQRWELYEGSQAEAHAKIRMSCDTAWRLFTKGLTPPEIEQRIILAGDQALGLPIRGLVAIVG